MADDFKAHEAAGVPEILPNLLNEFAVHKGENLPNHSASLMGRGKFVLIGMQPIPPLRTKQQAYCLAAYLVSMAETLPDEDTGAYTFEEIREAIENA